MERPTIDELMTELINRGIPITAAAMGAPKLHQALTDPEMALLVLDPCNTNYRAIWSRVTGVKLPRSSKATTQAILSHFRPEPSANRP